jgi:hypothetical protein
MTQAPDSAARQAIDKLTQWAQAAGLSEKPAAELLGKAPAK